jgi:hypothetical protein
MKNLRDELNLIINTENIRGISFVRLNEWQWVLKKIASAFLVRGEYNLGTVWLWEYFKEPYTSFQPESAIVELNGLLNSTEHYFFIASEENGKYWVMEGDGASIICLIKNSFCFEYYIANKSISWLLCENHHGVMVQIGSNTTTRKNA